MSEKRLASSGDSFVGLTEMQIGDLLNELSDENTRLHKKVDEQQATIDKLCTIIDWADSQFENDDTDLVFKWNAFVEKQGLNLEQIVNRGF